MFGVVHIFVWLNALVSYASGHTAKGTRVPSLDYLSEICYIHKKICINFLIMESKKNF